MKRVLTEIFQFALIAVFIILPFRLFVAQPFLVNGQSMYPTFNNGDYLIVDQLSYRFEDPERGSVLIFRYPNDPSTFFIKRIIGLPGEKIEIEGNVVKIDGEVLSEEYVKLTKTDNLSVTLAPDEYFVMGDNRSGSSDSRYWGPLEKKHIIGRPIIQLIPINQISIFPGDYSN
ncbi:MAG: signal peptidase I [Candidatus Pacebacteria bacterium]|nr:signal peptidase I [Candidatus Paceibacterota bacterium]